MTEWIATFVCVLGAMLIGIVVAYFVLRRLLDGYRLHEWKPKSDYEPFCVPLGDNDYIIDVLNKEIKGLKSKIASMYTDKQMSEAIGNAVSDLRAALRTKTVHIESYLEKIEGFQSASIARDAAFSVRDAAFSVTTQQQAEKIEELHQKNELLRGQVTHYCNELHGCRKWSELQYDAIHKHLREKKRLKKKLKEARK